MTNTIRGTAIVFVLSMGLGAAGSVLADVGCYGTGSYPAVYQLQTDKEGVEVTLTADTSQKPPGALRILRVAVRGADGSWHLKTRVCTQNYCAPLPVGWAVGCRDHPVPNVPQLTDAELKKYFPQYNGDDEDGEFSPGTEASSCLEQGGIVWFDAESGCWGDGGCSVHGLGRYDPASKLTGIERPAETLEQEITPWVAQGGLLWADTASIDYECRTLTPGKGLARYDWTRKEVITFAAGTDSQGGANGPCGFLFNSALLTKEGLWVSSDVGVSLLTNPWDAPANFHWRNFVPSAAGSDPPMKETDCATVYADLLKKLPHQDKSANPWAAPGYYEQLHDMLAKLNPGLFTKLTGESAAAEQQ